MCVQPCLTRSVVVKARLKEVKTRDSREILFIVQVFEVDYVYLDW